MEVKKLSVQYQTVQKSIILLQKEMEVTLDLMVQECSEFRATYSKITLTPAYPTQEDYDILQEGKNCTSCEKNYDFLNVYFFLEVHCWKTKAANLHQLLTNGGITYKEPLKVLQMVDNPASREINVRQKSLDHLRRENNRLLEIIKYNTPKKEPIMVPVESLDAARLDAENYRKELSKQKVLMDRLNKVKISHLIF